MDNNLWGHIDITPAENSVYQILNAQCDYLSELSDGILKGYLKTIHYGRLNKILRKHTLWIGSNNTNSKINEVFSSIVSVIYDTQNKYPIYVVPDLKASWHDDSIDLKYFLGLKSTFKCYSDSEFEANLTKILQSNATMCIVNDHLYTIK